MEYKKRRTALYLRVSTSEQKKHWYSLISQRESLTKHMLSVEEYWFYYDEASIYVDAWLSWWLNEDHRPWLSRMMDDIQMWKIQAILVWKIDRIARSTIILLDLVEKFKQYWVEFISKTEQIDTSSPNWIFFLTILWAFAEMERKLLSEKSREWKDKATGENKWVYGSPPFGYIKNRKTKELEVDNDKRKFIERVFELYTTSDKSINDIVPILEFEWYWKFFNSIRRKVEKQGKIDSKTISDILNNKAYINDYYVQRTDNKKDLKINKIITVKKEKADWKKYELPRIIDENIFNQAQEKLKVSKARNNNKWKWTLNHLFKWLLLCWECWSKYQTYRKKKGGVYHNYCFCSKKSELKFWENRCNNSQVSEEYLKNLVFTEINKIVKNPKNYIDKLIKEDNNHFFIAKLKEEIQSLNTNKENLVKQLNNILKMLYSENNDNTFKILSADKTDYEEKIKNVDEYIKEKTKELNTLVENENNKKELIEFYEKLKNIDIYSFTIEEQHELLNILISSITIYKDNKIKLWLKLFNWNDNDDIWWWDDDGDDWKDNDDNTDLSDTKDNYSTKKGFNNLVNAVMQSTIFERAVSENLFSLIFLCLKFLLSLIANLKYTSTLFSFITIFLIILCNNKIWFSLVSL